MLFCLSVALSLSGLSTVLPAKAKGEPRYFEILFWRSQTLSRCEGLQTDRMKDTHTNSELGREGRSLRQTGNASSELLSMRGCGAGLLLSGDLRHVEASTTATSLPPALLIVAVMALVFLVVLVTVAVS